MFTIIIAPNQRTSKLTLIKYKNEKKFVQITVGIDRMKNSVCPGQAGWSIYMTKIVPLGRDPRNIYMPDPK